MRIATLCAAVIVGAIGCGGGGGSTLFQHPTLEQDYTNGFVGTWDGSATVVIAGQTQTQVGSQRIDRAGFNRISIAQVCSGRDGAAGLNSPTTFSMDPVTCAPTNASCGALTIRYDGGTGVLDHGTLTMAFQGTASGCGQTLSFTLTFVGTLPAASGTNPDGGTPDAGLPDAGVPDAGTPDAGPADHGPPSVSTARGLDATVGVPLVLDASASADPDGRALTFAWTITSHPPGAAPVLTGADTSTPAITAMVEGTHVLTLVVTASDGQSASATVSIFAHQPIAAGQSFVRLQSDPGDYIGAGRPYEYTKANARILVTSDVGHLSIVVDGDENWQSDFQMPSGFATISPGLYDGLHRYPFHDPTRGGLDWSGEGRGCNMLDGSFAVDSVTYTGGTLTAIDLRFEQHCEGLTPALHGQIHWDASDPTQPPGPLEPPPDLWRPAPGFTPPAGNYVHLESDPGDYIGSGSTFTYTVADALISVPANGTHLSVGISGDENWNGDFQAMSSISQLQVGYYGNLQRYPFHNPARGGLDWSGEGRGCNTLSGWFVVDSVTYSGGTLSAIDLRFEQHCEGLTPALHGQIHWDANDTTQPPGPVQPPPADLWQPGAGTTPAAGNYVYLQSDSGDYIGGGGTFTYTPGGATISLSATGNRVSIAVAGTQYWNGDFQAMSTIAVLQPGYYGNLERYPFHNPARGGLDWYGDGRGCNTLTGWFVVDTVTYVSGALDALDLRFEQHCEGAAAALRGKIHWTASGT